MFYEVRILKPNGKIQKTFSADQLSRNYWKKFIEEESNLGFRAQYNARLFKKNKSKKN